MKIWYIFLKMDILAECECFPAEFGPVAHGEGIIFNRKQKEIYFGTYCFGARNGRGRIYSDVGNLIFEGKLRDIALFPEKNLTRIRRLNMKANSTEL